MILLSTDDGSSVILPSQPRGSPRCISDSGAATTLGPPKVPPQHTQGAVTDRLTPLRVGYQGAQWTRKMLFNGHRGEIGFTWGTFKVLSAQSWPESEDIPGSESVVFACGSLGEIMV